MVASIVASLPSWCLDLGATELRNGEILGRTGPWKMVPIIIVGLLFIYAVSSLRNRKHGEVKYGRTSLHSQMFAKPPMPPVVLLKA